jgi:hypothetical protein
MDVLHELITNMSMAEKSYFKRYASKLSDDSSTHYMHLFDSIALQQEYDEAALKQKFRGQKFVKQFSVAKTYLYKTIIKALKNFHEESNVQSQLKHLQLELGILMDKGIYPQAGKVISKGVLLADAFEMFNDLNEFLTAELYLLMNSYEQPGQKRSVEQIINDYMLLGEKTKNLVAFENLYQQQHRLNKTVYQLRDEEQLKQYNAIFNHPLLSNKAQVLSSRALYYFHFIRSLHFSVTDNRLAFLKETKLLVAVCYASKHFKEFDIRACLNALNLLLEASYFNGDWKAMNDALKKIRLLPVKSERDKMAQFIYYSRFGLIYFDRQGLVKDKRALIEESWKNIQRYEKKIPYHIRVSLLVTYSSALMEMGEYEKALDWIELYRQGKKVDETRYDVQSILLMLQLIAHYELGNLLLVKNIVPNITRFIVKIGQQSKFEKVVLSFFNKLTSSKMISEKIFADTLNALNVLKEGDILNRNRTLHDIFRAFIESKKIKKKYHEVLMQQAV